MESITSYSEEAFIEIAKEQAGETITDFCIYLYNVFLSETDTADHNIALKYMAELKVLLETLPCPYTIIQEFFHVDSSFRDTYYTYYSNQHFNVGRFSIRLSFFSGILKEEDFFTAENTDVLEKRLMGTCVINPLPTGVIGRTLAVPRFLLSKYPGNAYLRLSQYTVHIYGKTLRLNAFPYRMQDEETMRCAEVTILNLLDYYSNSYKDYRCVVPSEILDSEQKHHHERVLPSRGISYPILTKVLTDFGFYPRLYNLSSIDKYCLSRTSQQDQLKRCLHYYIESGIPVALNLLPIGFNDSGHSIVCIGHGKPDPECRKKAEKKKWIPWKNRSNCHPLIDSADFCDEYVVVDDNQPVYQIRKFTELSLHPDMRVENIAVPLYKRMFLDATDAASIVRTILHDEIFGIDNWSPTFLAPGEDIIIRLFMTSSCNLKGYRADSFRPLNVKKAYSLTPMPRFVWVCELYRKCDYDDLNAFGELVIDATSVPGHGPNTRGLILMHYPGVISIRYPEDSEAVFDHMLVVENDALFHGYAKNLTKI